MTRKSPPLLARPTAKQTARRTPQAPAVSVVLLLTLSLAGCSNLFKPKPPETPAATGAGAETAATETPAVYALDINAPDALKPLLAKHLDLARFQSLSGADRLTLADLNRVVQAAPAQARALLETEGYFNAKVMVRREAAAPGAVPTVRVDVNAGPRTLVDKVDIALRGPLQNAVQTNNPAAAALALKLRQDWQLSPGKPFRQATWSDAKTTTLTQARAEGYPAASWGNTTATVDAPTSLARLNLALDSGPLFHFGDITTEGLKRYNARAVTNLRTFAHGTPYSEKLLLDFQERLQRANLFEGSVVEINPDPALADATPVSVRVTELPKNQAEFGIGFSDSTGQRLSVEHTNRRIFDRSFFGTDWTARNRLELGRDRQSLDSALTSHPLEGGWRNLLAGRLQREALEGATVRSARLRVGRSFESEQVDRLLFVEGTTASTRSDSGNRVDRALSGNIHLTFRRLDSVLQPSRGYALHGELGAGYALSDVAGNGPFARALGRINAYRPLGDTWLGSARLEAGQVVAKSGIGIPDTLLFRAGGDDSVRGYSFQSLGPLVNGTVSSGRVLLTGSLEAARPIVPSIPALLGAVFIDAGAAANNWGELKPVVGYGVGVRLRSPVGPLRLDLAYADELKEFRIHFGVGIAF